MFALFDRHLQQHGYLAMSGQIVDASIIAAPRQRNTAAEKAAIREGRIPEDWQNKPAKLAQKNRDGRWTLKRGRVQHEADGQQRGVPIAVSVFGYKNHVSTDRHQGHS